MNKRQMHRSETIVFSRFDQKARVVLPAKHSFLILCRGERPFGFVPDSGAGTYEIDLEMLAGGSAMSLPVAISIVPTKHVSAWEKMPAQTISQMLSAIEVETVGTRQ